MSLSFLLPYQPIDDRLNFSFRKKKVSPPIKLGLRQAGLTNLFLIFLNLGQGIGFILGFLKINQNLDNT